MQAWQEKASAQDFVLQMVMERIFYSSDGTFGTDNFRLGATRRGPLVRTLDHAETLPSPMPTDTRDNLLRGCAESIQLVRVGGEVEKNGHDLLSVSHS